MRVTKIRVATWASSLLAVALLLTACGPPGPRALLRGKDLLEAGKTADAIEELKTAITLMPTNAAAWNYLGVAYHRAGEWTNAVESYSRALRFNRELLEARFNLGALWLEQDRLDEAKSELISYTSRRPNDASGWVKLGTAQIRSRDFLVAEKSFREALRADGENVEAINGLGLTFAQRNRPRDAAEAFAAAVQKKSDYRPALLNLATVFHQQLNDRTSALKYYRQYLALQPRSSDWEAVQAIVQSLEPAASSPATHGTQATTAVAAVNVPRSAEPISMRPSAPPTRTESPPARPAASAPEVAATPRSANPVVQPTPTPQQRSVVTSDPPPPAETVKLSPEPVLKRADNEAQSPRTSSPGSASPSGTSKESSAAVVERPTPVARSTRGKVAPGRYDYQAPSIPAAGDRPAAHQALVQGQEAQRLRRTAEALQFYRRATQLDGSYFEAYYLLGLVAYEMRSFVTAAGAWEMAIALRPDSADARYNFALTLRAAGYPLDAADELEKLLALHPDEARGHLTLGNLYAEQLRDIPRARKHYLRVLQLDPRNPQAQAIRYWLVANPG